MDVNVEIFIASQLDAIQANASGRSKDHKELRTECQKLKETVRSLSGSSPPPPNSVWSALASLLVTALSPSQSPKIQEPALACLHKLVAYAFLQGETRPSGRLDEGGGPDRQDENAFITKLVVATARAVQASTGSTAAVQLGVVKTLLTMTTAEHFVLHGDCLMLAIRSVFNLAVTGSTEDLKRTASSALLQMLNTVVKKCQQQPDHSLSNDANTSSPATVYNESYAGDFSQKSSWVARLALLAEQGDVAGLELELGNAYQATHRSSSTSTSLSNKTIINDKKSINDKASVVNLERVNTPPDPRRALMRDWREEEWKRLTTAERDVSIVITAMCKLAARETGSGAGETYLHAGKLLALDMVDRVLNDPTHDWTMIRPELATVLRQPLSLVILRNCNSREYDDALVASIRIFVALLFAQTFRRVMKPEIGALYPTILLKPLEAAADHRVLENQSSSSSANFHNAIQIAAALEGIAAICASPQLMVDLFVNFDCSLQSANLFERTVKVASKHLVLTSTVPALIELRTVSGINNSSAITTMNTTTKTSRIGSGNNSSKSGSKSSSYITTATSNSISLGQPAASSKAVLVGKVHLNALKSCLATIKSLDTWAGPLKQSSFADEKVEAQAADQVEKDHQDHQAHRPLNQHILQRIHGDKATKAALVETIETFNRAANRDPSRLVGLLTDALRKVPGTNMSTVPAQEQIASFFREQNSLLDPTAIGEVLGGHAAEHVAIMHAYIDGERYTGMTLDDALRALLFGFRLPGEAQKIDRIIEKFAQRYCADNPEAYPSVDAAYLLAFAVIMLNTDAHNPMAESRISKDDFITMCMYRNLASEPTETDTKGSDTEEYVPIAPREELEALYSRIVGQEIVVREFSSSLSQNWPDEDKRKNSSNYWRRLAKTLRYFGLSTLEKGATQNLSTFSSLDSIYRRQVPKKSLYHNGNTNMELLTWMTAKHAEHARPMLHVTGDAILKGLASALKSSQTVIEAGLVLEGYEQAIRLAALLRDDALCTALTSGLAAAARLRDPPPPRSGEEARAVAALSKLISLSLASMTSSYEGEEQLGGAWVVIFRAIRDLEALRTSFLTDSNKDGAVESSNTAAAAAAASSSSGSGSKSGGDKGSRSYNRVKNGMGAVLWAETAGAVPLDKVFANSTALDGESVVVYFRALCAVSQEDLTQDGDETRDFGREFRKVNGEDCFLLHRLVECASINIRKRVRPFFVWRKIWAVVSQHLVGAACLPQSSTQKRHSYVAMYAVDGLRKLADEVVGVGVGVGVGVAMQASSNASASASTTGAEAIRPLNSVLRGAESASVRELAVACIAHVMGGQPLGEAGWGAALHALAIAASDPSPVVAGQALEAALPACQALYVNHSRLEDCISTLLAVVSRTSNVTALYSFQVLARQIAEHWNSVPERMNSEVWITLLSPLAAVARGDDRAEIADTAAAVLFQILQTHGRLLDDNDGPRHHEKTCRGWSAILKSVVFPLLSPPPPPPPAAAVEEENEKCIGNDTTNSAFMQLPRVSRHQKCPEGVARIARHASTHLPDLWSLASTVQSKDCIALLTVEFLIQNFILYQSNGSTQMTLMRVGIEQASLGVDIFGGGESNASWDSLVDVLVQSISTAARAQGNSRMNLRSGSLTTILMARWIAALVCNRAQKELGEKNAGRLVDALAKEVYENAASVNKSIEAIGPDWKHTNKDEQGSSPEEGSPEDGSPKDGSPKPILLRQEVEGGRLLLSTLRTIGFKDRLVHWALIIIRNCSSIVESPKSVSPTLRSALLRDAVDALCDGIENGNGNGNVVGVTMIKMDSSTKSEIFALASKLVMSTDGSLKKSVQRLLKVYGEDALRKL